VCFLLHKAGAASRLCAILVRDCTMCSVDSPSPALRTLGLSGNYPDGRTGNLPFIPFTRKNIAFAARTDLFYMVKAQIARRILRIQQHFFTSSSCKVCPQSGIFGTEALISAFDAILRPIFFKSSVFCTFSRLRSISHFITACNPAQGQLLRFYGGVDPPFYEIILRWKFFFLIYSASGTIGIQYLVSYKKDRPVSGSVLCSQ